jgi:sodium transport system permease protein
VVRWRAVRVIYRKEMLDLLRDRRTLISMVAVPLLAMPLLYGGLIYLVTSSERKAREAAHTVAVREEAGTLPGLRDALGAVDLVPVDDPDPRQAVLDRRAEAGIEVAGAGERPAVRLYADLTRSASRAARDRAQLALGRLKDREVEERLRSRGVPAEWLEPFRVEPVNVATPKKMAGFFLGSFLGYLIVLLMLTGGMYPAIDMTAGEKERRTLEILLAAPAGRAEIVLGKVAATITAVLVTAALTVTSFGISFALGRGVPEFRQLSADVPVNAGALLLMLLTLLPVAVLSASVLLAVSLAARSYKEAQSYLTPLLFVVMFLAMVSVLPNVQMGPALALVPVLNASQLIKEILTGEAAPGVVALTFAANLAYAALAFGYAVWTFKRESVLFRV